MLTDEIHESLDRVELTRLTRVYNAAFARGADALSDVMGEPIESGSLTALSGTAPSLAAALPSEVLVIEIAFAGTVSGDAVMIVSADDAAALADRLSGPSAGDDQAWVANMTRALERFIAETNAHLADQISGDLQVRASQPIVHDLRTAPAVATDEMMVRLSVELRIGQVLSMQMHQMLPLGLARDLLARSPGHVPPPPGPLVRGASATRLAALEGATDVADGQGALTPIGSQDEGSTGNLGMEHAPMMVPMGASGAQEAVDAVIASAATAVQPAIFGALDDVQVPAVPRKMDVLMSVPLQMAVEIGRVQVSVRDILHMAPGTVMSIQRPAGEPVQLILNGRPIGRAEVVEIDGDYGIRIVEIANVAQSRPSGDGDIARA